MRQMGFLRLNQIQNTAHFNALPTNSKPLFLLRRQFFTLHRFSCSVLNSTTMATRMAVRCISRRFSSGGKILSEEEKAAENVFIKKTEQEKLEKLARKGPKPEEKHDVGSGGTVSDAKPSSSSTSTSGASTEKVSTDSKFRNYGVFAGVITLGAALGWYLNSNDKKQEVHD